LSLAAGGRPDVTLAQHLDRLGGPHAAGVRALVSALAGAGVKIARQLARAVLDGRGGVTGTINVQGEAVKKLDLWANDVVVEALSATRAACLLVSEEMAQPLHLPDVCGEAAYVVCFDPVDGSSNLDVNGVVGTIFSVRERADRSFGQRGRPPLDPPAADTRAGTAAETRAGARLDHVARDAALPGTSQVTAGYIMYGPATHLVLTTGRGVQGFTLDPAREEYLLSHPDVRIPARGRTYSVNEGNSFRWPPDMLRFVRYLKEEDVATGRPYTARYAGSLVADFHRTLLEGGVFLYPADAPARGKATGKLRLSYEAAPMALVVEAAGGRASTGVRRILDVAPTGPHQRVPLIVGSPEDVALAEDFYAQRR
jgi:fructose-1,6-bisphosphatase I